MIAYYSPGVGESHYRGYLLTTSTTTTTTDWLGNQLELTVQSEGAFFVVVAGGALVAQCMHPFDHPSIHSVVHSFFAAFI